MTRRDFSEWIQRQKSSDPQIILGIRVMRQVGIQHSDGIMGYPNKGFDAFVIVEVPVYRVCQNFF